ncbi:MAG: putative nucleotidyltransferase substrate binding domain-containing protein [Pseudomonadota bacterium]
MMDIMQAELFEITDFLSRIRPFDALDAEARARLAPSFSVAYARRGSEILAPGAENHHLYIVRSGAVELHEMGDRFTARLGEGECFAFPSLLRDNRIRNQVVAIEDSLLYLLPESRFKALMASAEAVRLFFATQEAERLRRALAQLPGQYGGRPELTTVPTDHLLRRRPPVTAEAGESVAAVAQRMAREDVSTMLIVKEGRLVGILTDKDLRRRVLGAGLDPATPVRQVMTRQPLTVPAEAPGLDALLLMTRHNFHHLPVVGEEGALLGVISANDILSRLAEHPVYLTARIEEAANEAVLARVAERLPGAAAALVDAGAPARACGHFISSMGEAINRRLLTLAEARLGPPPVPYAWLVFGSLARGEQTALSDQDNGLLLADDFDVARDDAYFKDLASLVSNGLASAGYAYCKGGIMATNPAWRQPLREWRKIFTRWIQEPEPKALMHANIFFDLRGVHGAQDLVAALRAHVLEEAGRNSIFLAHMTANTRFFAPPLGFFRQFVLEHDKAHKDRLDIKKRGAMPVVELARILALAAALPDVETVARIAAVARAGSLASDAAADLQDAFAFISTVRLRHQARQIKEGAKPDNFIAPAALSRFERDHLKDAFKIVRHQLDLLASRFHAGGL